MPAAGAGPGRYRQTGGECTRPPEGCTVTGFLDRIVTWLRAGYPDGIPQNDYLPLLALLARRLTADEVKIVARELMSRTAFDDFDIGASIMGITDELPTPEDVERVRERLVAKGWPLDEPRDGTAANHGVGA